MCEDEIEQRAQLSSKPPRPRAPAAGPLRRPQQLCSASPAPARLPRRRHRLSVAVGSLAAKAACSASASSRSHPPKYFNSRSRASSALTRARTDDAVSLRARELPVRRAEQIDGGRAIGGRDDKGEDHVERRGEGLRRRAAASPGPDTAGRRCQTQIAPGTDTAAVAGTRQPRGCSASGARTYARNPASSSSRSRLTNQRVGASQ